MKIIGLILLARMHILLWIGRAAYRVACRYGCTGSIGSVFQIEAYRAKIYEKYGLRQRDHQPIAE